MPISRRAAFLRGASRTLDLMAVRRPRRTVESDGEALARDWVAVGDDLRVAMSRFDAARAR